MKPGYKTTEFYVAIIAAIIPVLLANQMIDEDMIAKAITLLSPVIASFGYSLSRGAAKKNGTNQ